MKFVANICMWPYQCYSLVEETGMHLVSINVMLIFKVNDCDNSG